MQRALMLVTNGYSHDPRVKQEAVALVTNGWQVMVLAWDRKGTEPAHEVLNGVDVRRCHVRSAYGLGLRQLAYLPRFWWWAVRKGRQLRPAIVHCHDLDTVPAGLLIGRASRSPVVFDAHEHLPSSLRGRVPDWFWRLSVAADGWLTRRTDGVITVGERLRALYSSSGARRVAVVGNYKDATEFTLSQDERAAIAAELQFARGLTVCYLGGLSPARAVLPLLDAAAGLEGVNVIVAGSGPLASEVSARCAGHSNLRYLGLVPEKDVAKYTAYSDVVYYGLDPKYANNHFSTPNKLFEALAAGKPVICRAGVGEVADIVSGSGCGIAVPDTDTSSLRAAMVELQDPKLYDQLAAAARAAYTNGYRWDAAEHVLRRVYADVLSDRENIRH